MAHEKEKCTLGIAKEEVEPIGILPLLHANGIKRLLTLEFNGTLYEALPGRNNYKTKFLNVSHYLLTMFKAKVNDLDLEEFLNDCKANNFPLDRQVKTVVFNDLNEQIITLVRRGKNVYRVSHIDGKSVAGSFTEKEILEKRKGSVFEKIHSGICWMKRADPIRPIKWHCYFEQIEEA